MMYTLEEAADYLKRGKIQQWRYDEIVAYYKNKDYYEQGSESVEISDFTSELLDWLDG